MDENHYRNRCQPRSGSRCTHRRTAASHPSTPDWKELVSSAIEAEKMKPWIVGLS